jgi:hypothetical protein
MILSSPSCEGIDGLWFVLGVIFWGYFFKVKGDLSPCSQGIYFAKKQYRGKDLITKPLAQTNDVRGI